MVVDVGPEPWRDWLHVHDVGTPQFSFQLAANSRSFRLIPSVSRILESSSRRSMQWLRTCAGTSIERRDPSDLESMGTPSWYFKYRLMASCSGVRLSIGKGLSASP